MKSRRPIRASFLAMLLLVCVPLSALAAPLSSGETAGGRFAGGDGSAGNPYQIGTAQQLAWLAEMVNGQKTDGSNGNRPYAELSYVLTSDVDLSGGEWTPIGNTRHRPEYAGGFKGSFDGRGHTIRGMYITRYNEYCGLFGLVAATGRIVNLSVSGEVNRDNETEGNREVGGLVGCNYGVIENCSSGVNVSNDYHSMGGSLVGTNGAGGVITRSHASGSVSGGYDSRNGGLVGCNSGTVANCHATGDVAQYDYKDRESFCYSGGLVGDNLGGVILDSYATGNVTGYTGRSVNGGLAGRNHINPIGWHILSPWSHATIQNCYATGRVSGEAASCYNGGLVGLNYDYIANSFSTGTVSGIESSNGGIAGWNYRTITNCYSLCDIVGLVGKNYNGGLAGWQVEGADISNCYFSGTISDENINSCSGGIAGWQKADSVIADCFYLKDGGLAGVGTLDGRQSYLGGDKKASFEGWDGGEMQSAEFLAQLNGSLANVRSTDMVWEYREGEMPCIRITDGRQLILASDVSKSDWFYDDVVYVMKNYIMDIGYDRSGAFRPNECMERCDVIAAFSELTRFDGREYADSTFGDAGQEAVGNYYSRAIAWGADNDIIRGAGGNMFAPFKQVTREELAVIVIRYAKFANIELPRTKEPVTFADDAEISDWAKDAVGGMVMAGLMNGKGNSRFDPKGNVTRAEMAAILHRLNDIALGR